jgi:hypothetical protein
LGRIADFGVGIDIIELRFILLDLMHQLAVFQYDLTALTGWQVITGFQCGLRKFNSESAEGPRNIIEFDVSGERAHTFDLIAGRDAAASQEGDHHQQGKCKPDPTGERHSGMIMPHKGCVNSKCISSS